LILLDFLLIFIYIKQIKMGQSKKIYEQAVNDFIAHLYSHAESDEDYQYELYRERQLEAEQQAYEQHLGDR
jgi:hemerythrin superfamily protein